MMRLLAAVAGVLVTSGLVLATVGARRTDAPHRVRTIRARATRTRWATSRRTRLLAAGAVGLAVWAVLGWPVAGAVSAVCETPQIAVQADWADTPVGIRPNSDSTNAARTRK